MRLRSSDLIAFGAALAVLAGSESFAASKVGVTDFGAGSSNLQLNNAGQVAGLGLPYSNGNSTAFLYGGGRFTTLATGFLPVALSDGGTVIDGRGPFDWYDDGGSHPVYVGQSIGNSQGTLVGSGNEITFNGTVPIAWRYTAYSETQKAAFGSYYGFGPISGRYFDSRNGNHIAIPAGDPIGQGTMSIIGQGRQLVPTAINDAGTVVGSVPRYPWDLNGPQHASTMNLTATGDSDLKDLGTLGGLTSAANAINDAGQVVGKADTAAGNSHAFLYTNGKMIDLGTLPGFSTSNALGLNDKGDVVGTSGGHAFEFSHGIMEDLNDRLPATLGITLDEADKINDSGQIIAYGHGADGVEHGYLLSPAAAPEPSTLALLGVAGLGCGIRRLRNRKA